MNLLIVGAGGHGVSVCQSAIETKKYSKICFVDDLKAYRFQEKILGKTIIGTFCEVERFKNEFDQVFVAIGNNQQRENVFEKLKKTGWDFATIIHPKACVSGFATVGKGTIICAGAVVNALCTIGEASIVNTKASLDHHCCVQSGVHISPGATICGNVTICKNAWVGAGSTVVNNVIIGKKATVGAGSLVLKNVPENEIWFGTPAKFFR